MALIADMFARTLQSFVSAVRGKYRENPFHNFYHGFSVMHAMFLLLAKARRSIAIAVHKRLMWIMFPVDASQQVVDEAGPVLLFGRRPLSRHRPPWAQVRACAAIPIS